MILVYRAKDGEAVSAGTVVADPLPRGMATVQLSDVEAVAWKAGEAVWDPERLAVVIVGPRTPIPEPVDVLAALLVAKNVISVEDAAQVSGRG